MSDASPAAIVDVDGTLVDTNYHHALSWFRALRQHDVVLPLARVHRHIGMGGDQIVAALAGEEFDAEHGDDVRAAETALYMSVIEEVQLLPGARAFLEALSERGRRIVLASSAKAAEVERYLDLLDARALLRDWTTSADVEHTKPAPDLVQVAVEKAGGPPAVMVGDTPWDCEAAARAGLETIAVLTGGFGRDELERAGAACVFASLPDVCQALERTPLR